MKNESYILGIGNYSEVIIELVETSKYKIRGLYHYSNDRNGEMVMGYSIIASNDELFAFPELRFNYFVGVGDNIHRTLLANAIRNKGGKTPKLIHPDAIISPSCEIGQGTFVHGNATIWTKASIGNDCLISPCATIAHHVSIGNGCLISITSAIGAYVNIGNNVTIGNGAIIKTGVEKIGSNSIVGAGAVVINSIEENSIVIGNPARLLKIIDN